MFGFIVFVVRFCRVYKGLLSRELRRMFLDFFGVEFSRMPSVFSIFSD